MKKTLITSMCLALALSSTACGGSQKKAAAQAVTEATPVPTTAVETTTIAATTASEPSTDKTLSSQRDEIPITSVLDTSAEFAQPEKNETLPQNTASFFALDADDFIEAFRIQTTNYDMCKWSEKRYLNRMENNLSPILLKTFWVMPILRYHAKMITALPIFI